MSSIPTNVAGIVSSPFSKKRRAECMLGRVPFVETRVRIGLWHPSSVGTRSSTWLKSVRSQIGPRNRFGTESWIAKSLTIRCTMRVSQASDASLAPKRWASERTSEQGDGAEQRKPNAVCIPKSSCDLTCSILPACTCQKATFCVRLRGLVGAAIL